MGVGARGVGGGPYGSYLLSLVSAYLYDIMISLQRTWLCLHSRSSYL